MSKTFIAEDGWIRKRCEAPVCVGLGDQREEVFNPCEGELVAKEPRKGDLWNHVCSLCGHQETFYSQYPRDKL